MVYGVTESRFLASLGMTSFWRYQDDVRILDGWAAESATSFFDDCCHIEDGFVFPRSADDLHADGQALRRATYRNNGGGVSKQIEPLGITHRFQILDFASLDDPLALAVAKCRDSADGA